MLEKAASDIYILVAHLSRRGVRKDAKDITSALQLARKAEAGSLSEEDEANLWSYYADLVESARPACIDSLYMAHYAVSLGWILPETSERKQSIIQKHLMILSAVRWAAVVVFLLTLFVVAYLTLTEGILMRTQTLVKEFNRLAVGQVEGTEIADIAAGLRLTPASSTASGAIAGSGRAPSAGSAASSDGRTPATLPAGDRSTGTGTVQPLASTPAPEAVAPGAAGAPAAEQPTAAGDSQAIEAARLEQAALRLEMLRSARMSEIAAAIRFYDELLADTTFARAQPTNAAGGPAPAVPNAMPFDTSLRLLQRSINNILSTYALPLLAATLGVFVHILRSSSVQFANLSLVASEMSNYWPRIILGVVGGLVVGWFLGQDQSGILASISPAALAFLVGYSVEVFFNILDSIIQALGARSEKSS